MPGGDHASGNNTGTPVMSPLPEAPSVSGRRVTVNASVTAMPSLRSQRASTEPS